MRDLTLEEIEEYFRFARRHSNDALDGFNQEQTRMIASAMMRRGVCDDFGTMAVGAHKNGESIETIMISLWVTAFQMGRECESRLLTMALKGARP